MPEEPAEAPALVEVPVDAPDPLTGRHREFVKADPLAGQHWDSRIWRRT